MNLKKNKNFSCKPQSKIVVPRRVLTVFSETVFSLSVFVI